MVLPAARPVERWYNPKLHMGESDNTKQTPYFPEIPGFSMGCCDRAPAPMCTQGGLCTWETQDGDEWIRFSA